MKTATISTHNGSVSHREHNIRNPHVVSKEKHINPSGSYEIWKDEKPKDAYERIFGDALFEYNEKQTRADRKIKSYYDHIAKDSKKHVVYEMIIGVYDKTGNISIDEQRDILKEFVDTWDSRNKNDNVGLELIGAYYHADEEGADPHVHCTYIGCADGYTKGLRLQSALDKALTQIGFITEGKQTAQIKWEAAQNQYLGSLCAKRGIMVSHPSGDRRHHLDTATYKATMQLQELDDKNRQLTTIIAEQTQELEKVKADLEVATIKRDSIKAQNSLYDVVKDAYREPERQIRIEERQAPKTAYDGTIRRPEMVVISADDFEYLRNRVKASTFVMNALDDLKRKGNELMKSVNQNRIIQELRDEINKITLHLRRAESERLKMYNQIQDITYWMASKPIDRDGHSIWDYFKYEKMQQNQAQEQTQELDELEIEEQEM